MSRAKKPKKPQFDPLAVPDDPREIAAIHSNVEAPGRSAESGPSAWTAKPWSNDAALTANDVWGAAITSMARRSKIRPIFDDDAIRLVIVITDVALKPDDVSRAIRRTAWITGTFTEARRLAEKVRWLDFCLDETIAHITQVASNELALALEDHPELTRDNILFLVWKEKKVSFGGVAKLDLAREICNGVFTIPDLATPPVYSDGYNDGNEDEDNDRGDWWKGGSK